MTLIQIASAGLGMIPQHLSMDQATEGPFVPSGGGGGGYFPSVSLFESQPRTTPMPQAPWWVRRRWLGRALPPFYPTEGRTPTPMPIPTGPGVTLPNPSPFTPLTPTSSMFTLPGSPTGGMSTGAPSYSSMFAAPSGTSSQAAIQSLPNALSGLDTESGKKFMGVVAASALAGLGWFLWKKHSGAHR